jgi:hypothetical protein
MVPTSHGGWGVEIGTVLFGEERFHYTTVSGTYTRKSLELAKLTGSPIAAAPFFMMLDSDKAASTDPHASDYATAPHGAAPNNHGAVRPRNASGAINAPSAYRCVRCRCEFHDHEQGGERDKKIFHCVGPFEVEWLRGSLSASRRPRLCKNRLPEISATAQLWFARTNPHRCRPRRPHLHPHRRHRGQSERRDRDDNASHSPIRRKRNDHDNQRHIHRAIKPRQLRNFPNSVT